MAYRVAKKCTERTEYYCLSCRYVKPDDYKKENWGCYVECNAENKCLTGKFNAKHFYCTEFRTLDEQKMDEIIQKNRKKEALSEFRKYARKYYSKEEADRMIYDYKDAHR